MCWCATTPPLREAISIPGWSGGRGLLSSLFKLINPYALCSYDCAFWLQ
jgi:hypothetical protein